MEGNPISQKISNQKTSLKNWKEELKKDLKNKNKGSTELYLISKEWLEEYEKSVFENEKSQENYKNFKLIDNNILINSNLIIELPSIFPLNEATWNSLVKNPAKEKPFKVLAFYNKQVVIFYLKKEERIIGFYFLDEKDELRQGYIQMYRKKLEENMLKSLKNDTPLEFLKKHKIKYDTESFQKFSYYEASIFNLESKEKIKAEELNVDKKEIIDAIMKNIEEIQEELMNLAERKTLDVPSSSIKIEDNEDVVNTQSSLTSIPKKKKDNKKGKEKEKDNKKEKGKEKENKKEEEKEDKKEEEKEDKKGKENKKEEEKAPNQKNESKNLIVPDERKLPNNEISPNSNIEQLKKKKTIINLVKSIFVKEKAKPGLKGLKNVGATCYMNATLQCFSNADQIRTEFLKPNFYEFLENNYKLKTPLTYAIAEVIKNLWGDLDNKSFSPEFFKQVINRMNPLFKGIAANDPKDLIIFLLMKIHKEINKIKENNETSNNNQLPNPYNFYEVYNDFIQYYTSQNDSLISEEFHGYLDAMTTCFYCRRTIHNVQSFNIFFFPLEEVRKFKGYYDYIRIPIIDCFQYYERFESYPSFYCNNCNLNYPAYSNSKIIKAPKTLIINLNRGRGLEYNISVNLEEYLDLKNFVLSSDSPNYYELKGVISHFGSNDDGGHFIAYCKNCNDAKWYKFNDQFVDECPFDDVINKGMPYVLFYSYIENQNDDDDE